MANSTKGLADIDGQQALKGAFNKEDLSLTVNGYLVGKVGRKIEMAIQTTNVANDTEVYSFSEDAVQLYELTVVYTSGTREVLLSAERTA